MTEHPLTPARKEALTRIVVDWISEGFTTPPYEDAYYDIFEWLGLASNDIFEWLDITRPVDPDSSRAAGV